MNDIRLALMAGTDIFIPECKLALHQPLIKEIGLIGEINFFTAINTFAIDNQGRSDLDNKSNFQLFMMVMTDKETVEKKEAVKQLFALMLPNKTIMFTPNSILLREADNSIMIDEENFPVFQHILKQMFCIKEKEDDESKFNPANEKAAAIAEKLMKGRAKIAALKGDDNNSIFSQYLSVLSVGLHIAVTELVNLTMFQLFDLMERYSLYINWDIDLRSRLAGGSPEKQPENWMKNLH